MPWYGKEQSTPFDIAPIEGLMFLSGEILSRLYHQSWVKAKKYPVISFPSGLHRELRDDLLGGVLNISGAFHLPRVGNRDKGFDHAMAFAKEYDYTVARHGENELLVFNSLSGGGYLITYDNHARQIANVTRFPEHAMELLNAESRAVLPPLYSNEHIGLKAVAPVKWFTPDSNWTWYASEYNGADTCFGLVSGFEVELGYFSLTELEGIRGALGLPIERDLHYQPKTLDELIKWHRDQQDSSK